MLVSVCAFAEVFYLGVEVRLVQDFEEIAELGWGEVEFGFWGEAGALLGAGADEIYEEVSVFVEDFGVGVIFTVVGAVGIAGNAEVDAGVL